MVPEQSPNFAVLFHFCIKSSTHFCLHCSTFFCMAWLVGSGKEENALPNKLQAHL